MDRKRKVYEAMVEARGRIPDERVLWRALGQRAGYSGRSDLVGFYGGRWPSMRREGAERVLTEHGWRRARELGVA